MQLPQRIRTLEKIKEPRVKLLPVFCLDSNHAHPMFSISYGHATVYCDSLQNQENVAAIYKTWRGIPDTTLNTVKKCSQEIDREITRKGKERENSISPHLPLTQYHF